LFYRALKLNKKFNSRLFLDKRFDQIVSSWGFIQWSICKKLTVDCLYFSIHPTLQKTGTFFNAFLGAVTEIITIFTPVYGKCVAYMLDCLLTLKRELICER